MKKIYFYLIGILLLVISFFLDDAMAGFFVENRVGFFDVLALFIHNIEGYVLFLFVLIILFVFKQKNKILPLLLTLVIYLGATWLVKVIVARPRPFTKFDFSDLGESGANANRSFPSGHSTAAASVIKFFEFNRVLLWVWIAIVILIMFSRIYLGMHYLSDVIAGLVLGYAISDFSIFLVENIGAFIGNNDRARRKVFGKREWKN